MKWALQPPTRGWLAGCVVLRQMVLSADTMDIPSYLQVYHGVCLQRAYQTQNNLRSKSHIQLCILRGWELPNTFSRRSTFISFPTVENPTEVILIEVNF
jgi:hypothetical protein